jgi:hypothetical protein
VPGLRRRRCSARRRYQRGPLKVAQATPWLIDRGDLLAVVQTGGTVSCLLQCFGDRGPIAPAQAVTTAVRPRAESCAAWVGAAGLTKRRHGQLRWSGTQRCSRDPVTWILCRRLTPRSPSAVLWPGGVSNRHLTQGDLPTCPRGPWPGDGIRRNGHQGRAGPAMPVWAVPRE